MNNEYSISTDKEKLNIPLIHSFLSTSYWAKDIPLSVVVKSIENSLCFGVYATENLQVGFARIITDYATFAYLSDVFIIEDHRGKGLSKRLIQTIVEHDDLQGLRRMMLGTADAHELYAKFGFTALNYPARAMEIINSEVYTQATSRCSFQR